MAAMLYLLTPCLTDRHKKRPGQKMLFDLDVYQEGWRDLPAVAASVATAIPIAAPITSTTIASVAASSSWTLFTRPGFIDGQFPAPHLAAVERLDGCLRLLIGFHLHKAETFGLAGVLVRDNRSRSNGAIRSKQVL